MSDQQMKDAAEFALTFPFDEAALKIISLTVLIQTMKNDEKAKLEANPNYGYTKECKDMFNKMLNGSLLLKEYTGKLRELSDFKAKILEIVKE